MTSRIDLLITVSLFIMCSCVPNNEASNKQKKSAAITNESTTMVSSQGSNKDKEKEDNNKSDDSNHNSKDTTPPTLPGFASFNKFYNSSNFPIQMTWGASIDANLSGYNYKICGKSDCRTSCGEQVSSIGTIPSGTINDSSKTIEGLNYACVQAFDKYKNTTSFTNVGSFTVDTIAPVASTFKIQSSGSRKEFTNDKTITWIADNISGASQICLLSSLISTNCSWISLATSGSYTLPAGDGLKTAYLFYRDEALNVSKPISATITLDQTPPSNVALSLSGSDVNIIGGADANFANYVVKFCDSPACSNVISSFQTKTTKVSLAEMIASNKTFYIAVNALDIAENISNITIVAYTPSVTEPTIPTTPTTPSNSLTKDIQTNGHTTCALSTLGKLKCWGGDFGMLALETGMAPNNHTGDSISEMGVNLPYINISNDFTISQFSLGGTSICALSTKGIVKCWGFNLDSSLGIGSQDVFVYVPTIVNVGSDRPIQVAAFGNHACILTERGAVKCWGKNTHGALGIGSTEQIGDDLSEMGENLKPVNLGSNLKVTKLSQGAGPTCALFSNHKVKCWGYNMEGQLGINTWVSKGILPSDMGDNLPFVDIKEDVADISTGNSTSCALLVSGKVICWGNNYYGSLGQGNKISRGYNFAGVPLSAVPFINFGNSKVMQISAGGDANCALFENGEAKCWGRNEAGNLGQGDTLDYLSPSSVKVLDVGTGKKIAKISGSPLSTCVILTDGQVKCWGLGTVNFTGVWNYTGDEPEEMGDNLLPLDLGF